MVIHWNYPESHQNNFLKKMYDIPVSILFTGLGLFNFIVGIGYWRGTYKLPYFSLNGRYLLLVEMGIGSGIFCTGIGLTSLLSITFPEVHIELLDSIIWNWFIIWIINLSPIINFLLILFGVKPKWIKWLEKEHHHSLHYLGVEARKMGLRNWQSQVQSQSDLENWVQSLAPYRTIVTSHKEEVPISPPLPRPPLPPREFFPLRDDSFKLEDKVIWERHDGQRFLARVVKLSPQRVMIKLVDESRYTLVKPENIYRIE